MNDTSLDNTIAQLTSDLEPVKKLAHPALRAALWIVAVAIYAACAVVFIGIRDDIYDALVNPAFIFETLMGTGLFVLSAVAVLYMCIPDMSGHKWLLSVTYTLAGTFCLWIGIQWFAQGMKMPHMHWDHCMTEGLVMTLVPLVIMFFMTRQGATTRPYTTALLTIIAVSALAYVGLRFTCSMDAVWHSFLGHIMPFVVIGVLSGLAARKLYKW